MRNEWFSIAIIGRCFWGRTYVRQAPIDSNATGNVSEIDFTDDWPFKIRLTPINYACTTPDPNLDLVEEDLIAAWRLPPKSRLSPTMRRIARCEVFAAWINRTKIDFDANRCRCFDARPIIVMITAVYFAIIDLYRCLFGFSIDKKLIKNVFDILPRVSIVFFHMFLTAIIVWFTDFSPGLLYTLYGDAYSKEYYSKLFEIEPMLVSIFFINVGECLAYVMIVDLVNSNIDRSVDKLSIFHKGYNSC